MFEMSCHKTKFKDVLVRFLIIILGTSYLIGCYSIPKASRDFLEDYNARNPQSPSTETVGELITNAKNYTPETITIEHWQSTEHFKDKTSVLNQTAHNIRFIIENIPDNGVLLDGDGKEVLTFTRFVVIDPVGSMAFPVIYPETKKMDFLGVIEAKGALQNNTTFKKLGL